MSYPRYGGGRGQNPIGDFFADGGDWDRMKHWISWGLLAILIIVGLWTSVYTVQPEGNAVVKRFGRVIDVREPGLHFKIPFGVDTAHFVPTERVLKQEFGFRTVQSGDRASYMKTRQHADESLMLTGDLNVIDVEWVVQYRVSDPDKYLHRVRDQERTIRDISEAVMRRIAGNRLGSDVLTVARVSVANEAKDDIQRILNLYDIGVQIGTVELQDVTPPERVKPAFNAVNEARQERERLINVAEQQRNREIPQARGQANQAIAEAEGAAAERVNQAQGETARYRSILEQYSNAPEITRQRLYLETIDRVLPRVGRMYVVEQGQTMPIPLLNLSDQIEALPQGGAR